MDLAVRAGWEALSPAQRAPYETQDHRLLNAAAAETRLAAERAKLLTSAQEMERAVVEACDAEKAVLEELKELERLRAQAEEKRNALQKARVDAVQCAQVFRRKLNRDP